MKSRIKMMFAAGVMAACIAGGSITAYAMSNDTEFDYEAAWSDIQGNDIAVNEPETPDLNISFDVNNEMQEGTGVFTPDGNLTLVDDLDEDESSSLQYMTVQTKAGNTFYIIIDRSTKDDNVYFLNTVDEADLMALMNDETKAQFDSQTEAAVDEKPLSTEMSDEEDKGTQEEEKKKSDTSNPLVMLLIFGVLGGGAAFAYYKFKIKPQKEQAKVDEEEMEFIDDEEYEQETYENVDTEDENEEED